MSEPGTIVVPRGVISTVERCSDLGKQRTIIGTICGQDGTSLVVA